MVDIKFLTDPKLYSPIETPTYYEHRKDMALYSRFLLEIEPSAYRWRISLML